MRPPLRFAFVVHIHQPIGNFDEVFREHVEEVYRPFLAATGARGCRPITLHVSGPLLDWLEENDAAFLDEIGREVADGRIELLGSGRYEPVLVALPRRDRIEQIEEMREALRHRFGVTPDGLWLTERVWEQDLASDLAAAGVRYVLLDDRHFLSAGLARADLDRPFHTESDGRGLGLLSIDQRLRYLVPFQPVEAIESFFQTRHADGDRLVVLGDDGEKFGGWPGTRARVYDDGWLEDFLSLLDRLQADGTLDLVTAGEAARDDSGGLVYPTPGSYREMEDWTLPRPAALELEEIQRELPDSEAVRGGHWRNFLIRYPESNRMHKLGLALSKLCRERGDPPEARTAIARAQCNDAYWHGVFGGVYLPHLRQAVWRELAVAEAILRRGETLDWQVLDLDFDGHDEVWVHSAAISAVISPRRGGAIESLLRLDSGENDADVLGRHFEAYHGEPGVARPWSEIRNAALREGASGGVSIHDRGTSIHDRGMADRRPAPPAVDRRARALFQERVALGSDSAAADSPASDSPGSDPGGLDLAGLPFALREVTSTEGEVVVSLEHTEGGVSIRKRLLFGADGAVRVELEWDPKGLPEDGILWTELSLAHERRLTPTPVAEERREEIVTLARSERGYEEIRQGVAVSFGWPVSLGRGSVGIVRSL